VEIPLGVAISLSATGAWRRAAVGDASLRLIQSRVCRKTHLRSLRPASLYDVSYGSDQCGSLRHISDEGHMIAGGLGSLLGILQKPIFKTRGNFEIIIGHGLFAISVITVKLRQRFERRGLRSVLTTV
jgi:hypothetical protein